MNNWGNSGLTGWSPLEEMALNSFTPEPINFVFSAGQNAGITSPDFNFTPQLSSFVPQFQWTMPQTGGSSNPFGDFVFTIPQTGSGWSWGVPSAGGSNNSGSLDVPPYVSENNKKWIFGSGKIKPLDPDMQKAVIELIKRYYAQTGKTFEISEGYCSAEERKARRDNAKDPRWYAKHSQHPLGRAIDISRKTTSLENLVKIGKIWRDEMGFTSGLDFHDTPEIEPWQCDLRPDIRYNRGYASTWLGKGGQSAVASRGSSNPWEAIFRNMFAGMNNWSNNWSLGWGRTGNFSGTSDEVFERALAFILKREGGYGNLKYDHGGETSHGITHKTYDLWRTHQGLPTRNVKYITDEEVRTIYYNSFWKGTGADKIRNPKLALQVFDAAASFGPGSARALYQQSGDDLQRFVELRKQKYIRIVEHDSTQRGFLHGWLERTDLGLRVI